LIKYSAGTGNDEFPTALSAFVTELRICLLFALGCDWQLSDFVPMCDFAARYYDAAVGRYTSMASTVNLPNKKP